MKIVIIMPSETVKKWNSFALVDLLQQDKATTGWLGEVSARPDDKD